MIERTVLLHQDHHMLHILDRARAVNGRNGQCLGDRRRECAVSCGRTCGVDSEAEKLTSVAWHLVEPTLEPAGYITHACSLRRLKAADLKTWQIYPMKSPGRANRNAAGPSCYR